MRKVFLIVLLSTLISSHVFADEAFERLMNAKSLKCVYGPGAVAIWEDSKVKVEKDNFNNASVVFDSIDIKTGKARMIGEIGAVAKLDWHGLAPLYHQFLPPMLCLRKL